jgi:hypothetical protein
MALDIEIIAQSIVDKHQQKSSVENEDLQTQTNESFEQNQYKCFKWAFIDIE